MTRPHSCWKGLAVSPCSEITQERVEVPCTVEDANHRDSLFSQAVEDVMSVESGDGPETDTPESLPGRLHPDLKMLGEELEGRRGLVVPARGRLRTPRSR